MAAQVLSGSSNVSYTNNTGQNVRVIINYMSGANISMSWASVTVSALGITAIGRNIAYVSASSTNGNNATTSATTGTSAALPTEVMLAAGQTFSATNITAYNILVIPEGG